MTTACDSGIYGKTARLALMYGWFHLADKARERGDLDEARICESNVREYCSDEEEYKRLLLVYGWFRLADAARECGDLQDLRFCEDMALQFCNDEDLRDYLDMVIE